MQVLLHIPSRYCRATYAPDATRVLRNIQSKDLHSFRGEVTLSDETRPEEWIRHVDHVVEVKTVNRTVREEANRSLRQYQGSLSWYMVGFGASALGSALFMGFVSPPAGFALKVVHWAGGCAFLVGGVVGGALSAWRISAVWKELEAWQDPVERAIRTRRSIGEDGYKSYLSLHRDRNWIMDFVAQEEQQKLWSDSVRINRDCLETLKTRGVVGDQFTLVESMVYLHPLRFIYGSHFAPGVSAVAKLGAECTLLERRYEDLLGKFRKECDLLDRAQRGDVRESNDQYVVPQAALSVARDVEFDRDVRQHERDRDDLAFVGKRVIKDTLIGIPARSLEASRQRDEGRIRDKYADDKARVRLEYQQGVAALLPDYLHVYQRFTDSPPSSPTTPLPSPSPSRGGREPSFLAT